MARPRRSHLLVLAAALAALVVTLAACGGEETKSPVASTVVGTLPADTTEQVEVPAGDPAAGAEVFASAGCGSCHVLADAGAAGAVGPNLDESQPSNERTYTQVLNGGGGMPPYKDQLDEQQIADVTAYVVQATGGEPVTSG